MKPDIKWLTQVPKTKEECMQALERDDAMMQSCMQGIFECLVAQGKSVMKAYEEALLASISDEVKQHLIT
jgi:hypothetical protein